jgi:2-polyprenyl-3-methyl-5-hydroxy-6-metoxy-1,4-benzoquinol methylase
MNKKSNPYQDHQCDIYSNPKQYDAINSFEHDIPFYIEQAKKSGKNVLELACGTGRVAIPLAKAGLNVTGIDLSPIMLEYGRKKAKEADVTINFLEGDMTNFSLNEKFDTVMCIHNSLGHVYDLVTIKNFFNCIKNHLTPKGTFILQTFTPDPYFFVRDKDEKLPFTTYKDPDTGADVEIYYN